MLAWKVCNVARVVVAAACLGGAEKCIETRRGLCQTAQGFRPYALQVPGYFLRSGRSVYAVRPAQDSVDARRMDESINITLEPGSFTQKQINPHASPNVNGWLLRLAVEAAKRAIHESAALSATPGFPRLDMTIARARDWSYVSPVAEGAANIMEDQYLQRYLPVVSSSTRK